MSHFIHQEHNEQRFGRHFIDAYIREAIQNDAVMQDKIAHGVQLVGDLINGDYYASKMARMAQLKALDIVTLVTDIFIGIAYCLRPELFTSVTAQLAARLRFNDKTEAITTTAELVAVLCETDAFDLEKPTKYASITVVSRMNLSDKLIKFIRESQYLPPMVVPPMKVSTNYESGYLTFNDSLLLGSGNHHDGDLCLDVINLCNAVELQLDLDFLCKVEEEPTFELDTQDKKDGWMDFKKQSYRFYDLIQSQGNVFHLTHKVDKRGRLYASGYHITTQGSGFKKAMIELANEEYIEGVP